MDWRELLKGIRDRFLFTDFALTFEDDGTISITTRDEDVLLIEVNPDDVVNTLIYVDNTLHAETGFNPALTVEDHINWLEENLPAME